MKILSLGLDKSVLDKNSELARRLVKYGELVEKYTVVVPSRQSAIVEISERVRAYGSGGGNKIFQLFKLYNLAKNLLTGEKYDVITVQDQYYLALIGLRLAKKFKAGLEIQVHGFEKYRGLRKLAANYVLPRANAVRCVSQRLAQELVKKSGVDEGKITVVAIYSELRITNYELRIKKNTGKFIFLTVGRLVPVKNIGLQIEAMRKVVKQYPECELRIVGDGEERKNYESRIMNYGLGNKIKMLGWQNELDKYYEQADAFVLTSSAEGWGLAVIEAAAAGLPIIMTEVGCAGEVIKNEESGLIIPVGDARALAQAMIRLIEDRDLRQKLGEGARQAVSRLPSEAETLGLYKKSWEIALKI